MKKISIGFLTLILLLCLGAFVPALAGPYLAVNPSTEPITIVKVEVTAGTNITETTGIYTVRGGDALVYDLANITSNGPYRFRIKWARSDGWYSGYSPFFDSSGPAVASGALRIVQ